ncbi:MAG: hypothetical protein ACRDJW_22375 [Thermomicrobiales bacterium]
MASAIKQRGDVPAGRIAVAVGAVVAIVERGHVSVEERCAAPDLARAWV